ncbi:MAG: hypothetical protein QHI48_10535 [Bacteroidota bacterium]|nr:hypothetical protein [Bacteroidota bacterium]
MNFHWGRTKGLSFLLVSCIFTCFAQDETAFRKLHQLDAEKARVDRVLSEYPCKTIPDMLDGSSMLTAGEGESLLKAILDNRRRLASDEERLELLRSIREKRFDIDGIVIARSGGYTIVETRDGFFALAGKNRRGERLTVRIETDRKSISFRAGGRHGIAQLCHLVDPANEASEWEKTRAKRDGELASLDSLCRRLHSSVEKTFRALERDILMQLHETADNHAASGNHLQAFRCDSAVHARMPSVVSADALRSRKAAWYLAEAERSRLASDTPGEIRWLADLLALVPDTATAERLRAAIDRLASDTKRETNENKMPLSGSIGLLGQAAKAVHDVSASSLPMGMTAHLGLLCRSLAAAADAALREDISRRALLIPPSVEWTGNTLRKTPGLGLYSFSEKDQFLRLLTCWREEPDAYVSLSHYGLTPAAEEDVKRSEDFLHRYSPLTASETKRLASWDKRTIFTLNNNLYGTLLREDLSRRPSFYEQLETKQNEYIGKARQAGATPAYGSIVAIFSALAEYQDFGWSPPNSGDMRLFEHLALGGGRLTLGYNLRSFHVFLSASYLRSFLREIYGARNADRTLFEPVSKNEAEIARAGFGISYHSFSVECGMASVKGRYDFREGHTTIPYELSEQDIYTCAGFTTEYMTISFGTTFPMGTPTGLYIAKGNMFANAALGFPVTLFRFY